MFMEHNPHETPSSEIQAPIVYPSGHRQDDTSDNVMASSTSSPSLGTYDDMSLMGSGFYPQRYGDDHYNNNYYYDYHRDRAEEDGKSMDPKLMMLLEYFRQLFIRRKELLSKIFPGVQDECVDLFKKVGDLLGLRIPSHNRVVMLRRSLSVGSRRGISTSGVESSLRLDRFKVRTVVPGGGTIVQGGGDDDRKGDKTSDAPKSK